MLDTTHDAGLIEGIPIGGPTLTDGTEAVAEPLAVAGKMLYREAFRKAGSGRLRRTLAFWTASHARPGRRRR